MGLFTKKQEEVQQEPIEQQPQPQLMGGGTPYYQPTIMPSEKADLYDKIRPEDVVETAKYLLMGYKWNNMRQEWLQNPVLKNISLNEVGATQLATLLFPVSNKSVSISKLDDNEIRMRCKYLVRTAMKNCLEQWESYGIRTPATILFVKEVMLSIAFITLKQPEGAGVRTFIQGTHSENKTILEQPRKEGWASGMFRR